MADIQYRVEAELPVEEFVNVLRRTSQLMLHFSARGSVES
jgi:hypothetical protein